SHAYLFYGSRGTGKTTIARIFSKIINCQKRQEDENFAKQGEPCGECHACLQVEEGRALDVVEIDAASNRGIDEIRNLKENIKTLPSYLKYKIFIIDEVHMLTPQAFNALLKTLEEPPAHAVFILATTEYDKLPPTIVSRTQRFHFRKLTLQEIIKKLSFIAKEEKVEYEKEALEMIAFLAEGSLRDAESLFDQIVSMKGKNITVEYVESILGKVDFLKTIKMADLVIKKDLQKSLEFLYEINSQGYNLFQFNKDLTEYLRRVLSLHLNPELEKIFEKELAESQIKEIKKHSAKIDTDEQIKLIKALITAYSQMKYNPFPLVPFEIAIIENLK
ncbi:MAG: DNA polymerase III subunit gamma/tau, partial [Candidatus Paceibacterota bacterium]